MSELRWVLIHEDGTKEICLPPTATDALEYANDILNIKDEFDCCENDVRLGSMWNIVRLLGF